METSFWHEKWEKREIGFHEGQPNGLLVDHFSALNLREGERVFVPLCGKSRDIAWFLQSGFQVSGAELSEVAVQELFQELELSPEVSGLGSLKRYSAQSIDIFVGDIFDVTPDKVGKVDAVYDRAALVALPSSVRSSYTAHLIRLSQVSPLLVIAFQYEQSEMEGPPFSISPDELLAHYGERYRIQPLKSREVPGGLKGTVKAVETAYRLIPI
jgi:thiopurine S-methyltransferase